MIQPTNDSRATYYLRSGDPKGEEGHGGRIEGHHDVDELSADKRNTATKGLKAVWNIAPVFAWGATAGGAIATQQSTLRRIC